MKIPRRPRLEDQIRRSVIINELAMSPALLIEAGKGQDRKGCNDDRSPAVRCGLVCLTGGDEGPLAAATCFFARSSSPRARFGL